MIESDQVEKMQISEEKYPDINEFAKQQLEWYAKHLPNDNHGTKIYEKSPNLIRTVGDKNNLTLLQDGITFKTKASNNYNVIEGKPKFRNDSEKTNYFYFSFQGETKNYRTRNYSKLWNSEAVEKNYRFDSETQIFPAKFFYDWEKLQENREKKRGKEQQEKVPVEKRKERKRINDDGNESIFEDEKLEEDESELNDRPQKKSKLLAGKTKRFSANNVEFDSSKLLSTINLDIIQMKTNIEQIRTGITGITNLFASSQQTLHLDEAEVEKLNAALADGLEKGIISGIRNDFKNFEISLNEGKKESISVSQLELMEKRINDQIDSKIQEAVNSWNRKEEEYKQQQKTVLKQLEDQTILLKEFLRNVQGSSLNSPRHSISTEKEKADVLEKEFPNYITNKSIKTYIDKMEVPYPWKEVEDLERERFWNTLKMSECKNSEILEKMLEYECPSKYILDLYAVKLYKHKNKEILHVLKAINKRLNADGVIFALNEASQRRKEFPDIGLIDLLVIQGKADLSDYFQEFTSTRRARN